MQLHQDSVNPDALIVLGSRDYRVAGYEARLARQHNYKYIVVSGGIAHKNDLMVTTLLLAVSCWLVVSYVQKTITILTKLYMERRALKTFEAQWPDSQVELRAKSFGGYFDDYINDKQPACMVVNVMVGDLHRIMKYPGLRLQPEWSTPGPVMTAF